MLQEPWRLACGLPHNDGSGVPAVISDGTDPAAKNHIRIKSEVHCVA